MLLFGILLKTTSFDERLENSPSQVLEFRLLGTKKQTNNSLKTITLPEEEMLEL